MLMKVIFVFISSLSFAFCFSAALSRKNKQLAKQKLQVFENTAGISRDESEKELVKEDDLANVREVFFFLRERICHSSD